VEDKKGQNPPREVFGKSSLTISAKPGGVGAAFQRLIPAGEQADRVGAGYLTFVTLPSAITVHGPRSIDASAWYV